MREAHAVRDLLRHELALAYARAYPARVERLILDSVADPDDSDPFGLAGFRAMRADAARRSAGRGCVSRRSRGGPLRARRRGCGGRRCGARSSPRAGKRRRAGRRPGRDRRPALRRRLRAGAAGGRPGGGPRGAGRRRGAAAAAAADLGAASPCRRDPARLLGRPLRGRVRGDAAAVAARHAVGRPPRASRASARWRAGPAAFFPFDARTAFADEIELCLRWPDPGQPPAPAGGAVPGRPRAAAPGRGGPAHAARGLGAHRVAAPAVGARDGARASGTRSSARTRATAGSGSCCRWLAGERVRARCPRVETDVPAT